MYLRLLALTSLLPSPTPNYALGLQSTTPRRVRRSRSTRASTSQSGASRSAAVTVGAVPAAVPAAAPGDYDSNSVQELGPGTPGIGSKSSSSKETKKEPKARSVRFTPKTTQQTRTFDLSEIPVPVSDYTDSEKVRATITSYLTGRYVEESEYYPTLPLAPGFSLPPPIPIFWDSPVRVLVALTQKSEDSLRREKAVQLRPGSGVVSLKKHFLKKMVHLGTNLMAKLLPMVLVDKSDSRSGSSSTITDQTQPQDTSYSTSTRNSDPQPDNESDSGSDSDSSESWDEIQQLLHKVIPSFVIGDTHDLLTLDLPIMLTKFLGRKPLEHADLLRRAYEAEDIHKSSREKNYLLH